MDAAGEHGLAEGEQTGARKFVWAAEDGSAQASEEDVKAPQKASTSTSTAKWPEADTASITPSMPSSDVSVGDVDQIGETTSRRVAYIWSPQLENLASDLPSNKDRSKYVHSLVRVMDLLDLGPCISSSDLQADGGSVGRDEYACDPYEQEHGMFASVSAASRVGQEQNFKTKAKAKVVRPDLTLGGREVLERYHTKGYLDQIFRGSLRDPRLSPTSSSDSDETLSSNSDDSDSQHRTKRRKTDKKDNGKLDKYGLLHDCPVFPTLPDYITHIAAATSTACRLVANGSYDVATHWDGGRHHAHRAKASGFCYVADIQLGIMLLLKEGRPRPALSGPASNPHAHAAAAEVNDRQPISGQIMTNRKPRVMYLDLDLHYGDGVASAFHSPATFPCPAAQCSSTSSPAPCTESSESSTDPGPTSRSTCRSSRPPKMPKAPNVLTLSIHHSSPLFFPPPSPLSLLPLPSTASPFTLSIPLHTYPSARTYAAIWPAVEAVREAYRPDYVVLQLGVDGMPGDPVGKYGNWSTHGEGGVNWAVEKVKEWGVGTVVLGGGGYGARDSARAWAGATGVLLGRDMDAQQDIPHHDHFTAYAPNYTIDVRPGNARDENTPDYIRQINETYEVIAHRIAEIVGGSWLHESRTTRDE